MPAVGDNRILARSQAEPDLMGLVAWGCTTKNGYTPPWAISAPSSSRTATPAALSKPPPDPVQRQGRTPSTRPRTDSSGWPARAATASRALPPSRASRQLSSPACSGPTMEILPVRFRLRGFDGKRARSAGSTEPAQCRDSPRYMNHGWRRASRSQLRGDPPGIMCQQGSPCGSALDSHLVPRTTLKTWGAGPDTCDDGIVMGGERPLVMMKAALSRRAGRVTSWGSCRPRLLTGSSSAERRRPRARLPRYGRLRL
jgi:hypothetical protein